MVIYSLPDYQHRIAYWRTANKMCNLIINSWPCGHLRCVASWKCPACIASSPAQNAEDCPAAQNVFLTQPNRNDCPFCTKRELLSSRIAQPAEPITNKVELYLQNSKEAGSPEPDAFECLSYACESVAPSVPGVQNVCRNQQGQQGYGIVPTVDPAVTTTQTQQQQQRVEQANSRFPTTPTDGWPVPSEYRVPQVPPNSRASAASSCVHPLPRVQQAHHSAAPSVSYETPSWYKESDNFELLMGEHDMQRDPNGVLRCTNCEQVAEPGSAPQVATTTSEWNISTNDDESIFKLLKMELSQDRAGADQQMVVDGDATPKAAGSDSPLVQHSEAGSGSPLLQYSEAGSGSPLLQYSEYSLGQQIKAAFEAPTPTSTQQAWQHLADELRHPFSP